MVYIQYIYNIYIYIIYIYYIYIYSYIHTYIHECKHAITDTQTHRHICMHSHSHNTMDIRRIATLSSQPRQMKAGDQSLPSTAILPSAPLASPEAAMGIKC